MEPTPSELAENVNSLISVGERVLVRLSAAVRFGLDQSARYTSERSFVRAIELPRDVRAAERQTLVLGQHVIDLERVFPGVGVMRVASDELLVPCRNPGVGSGYELSRAWPFGLMRLDGMMLPGNGLPVAGSLTVQRLLERTDWLGSAVRSNPHCASRASARCRWWYALIAPLDPLFGVEEEQLVFGRVA